MNIPIEDITDVALALSHDARALLADRLVESLDPIENETVRGLWAREAQRRLEEIESGQVETIDREQALAEVREAIRR